MIFVLVCIFLYFFSGLYHLYFFQRLLVTPGGKPIPPSSLPLSFLVSTLRTHARVRHGGKRGRVENGAVAELASKVKGRVRALLSDRSEVMKPLVDKDWRNGG